MTKTYHARIVRKVEHYYDLYFTVASRAEAEMFLAQSLSDPSIALRLVDDGVLEIVDDDEDENSERFVVVQALRCEDGCEEDE